MKMDKWRTRSIWRSKKKDNHITSTSPTQKRKKFRVEVDVSGHAIGGVLS